jgi:hypothetical protein
MLNPPRADAPPLRVMSLHALAYCERLFYLEEVEEIRVADERVFAGRELHAAIEADEDGERTQLELEDRALGLVGKVDAIRRRDGLLIPYDRSEGSWRRAGSGEERHATSSARAVGMRSLTTPRGTPAPILQGALVARALGASVLTKQVADGLFVVDNHMEVRARHSHIAVACGRADLGQGTSAREGVGDECVAAVMDGQGSDALHAKHPTRRQEPPANGMALKRFSAAVGLDRADEWVCTTRALLKSLSLPRCEVSQRTRIPPQGHKTRLATLRAAAQAQVRPANAYDDIVEPQRRNLRYTQSAAARQPHDHQIAPRIGGSPRLLLAVGEYAGQLAACEYLRLLHTHHRKVIHILSDTRMAPRR